MSQPAIISIKPSASKILSGGLLLAVFTALAVLLASWANLDRGSLLFTAGCGAILGLIPTGSPLARIGAFLIGMVIAWVGYGFRAALLPDNPVAEALAAFVAITLVAVIGAASKGRIPVLALLLGLIAMTGSYDADFATAPYAFIAASVATVGATLAGAAAGMLAVVIADLISEIGKDQAPTESSGPPQSVPDSSEPLASPKSTSPIFNTNN